MARHFELELDQLRTLLIRMASLVEQQIDFAFTALVDSNIALADAVIKGDDKIDEFDNNIDQHCMRIFALSQPVAIDLRLLMAALRINSNLERVGDIAKNISERVKPLSDQRQFIEKTKLIEMSQAAKKMLHFSIDSFINNDSELAKNVLTMDDEIDALDRNNFELILQLMKENGQNIEAGSHCLILSRHIERLADHSTNIAEDVVFLVRARIVKHHSDEPASI